MAGIRRRRHLSIVHVRSEHMTVGYDALDVETGPAGTPPPRADLTDPERHGDQDAAPGLVDFAVNVRGTPPAFVLDAIRSGLDDLARYPTGAQERRAVDAIAAAGKDTEAKPWVMAPMIATVDETEDFVGLCRERGLEPAGIMVETPSAAITTR